MTASPTTVGAGSSDRRDVLALMRRTCIAMFLIGGGISFVGVAITQATPESKRYQALTSVGFLAIGLVVSAVRRPRRRLMEVSVALSILLLGILMGVSQPLGMGPVFYLWPVVFTAYFSTNRRLALMSGWAVVTFGAGLLANPTHELKADTFIGTIATVGVMAWLVAMMTGREERLRRELAVAAETDPLTGLLNRRSFSRPLEVLVRDAGAAGRKLSVVMFDLDHFKRLNDRYGHLEGDRALQDVAAILLRQSRDGDLVSRFGGEEFAVALPGADLDDASAYAERVATALCSRDPADPPLTTSAGIAAVTGPHDTAEGLLRLADECLYAAKAAGRARLAAWDGDIRIGPRFCAPSAA